MTVQTPTPSAATTPVTRYPTATCRLLGLLLAAVLLVLTYVASLAIGTQKTRRRSSATPPVSAYSREVLAATFDTHIDDLPNFPFTKEDPLIVERRNPVDAKAVGE